MSIVKGGGAYLEYYTEVQSNTSYIKKIRELKRKIGLTLLCGCAVHGGEGNLICCHDIDHVTNDEDIEP
jgi:hypothetical protein